MKGDRFEQMVERNYELNRVMDHNGVWKMETATLLRNEHAAVRRMVVRVRGDSSDEGHVSACDDILAALDRRKMKGSKVSRSE